MSHLHIHVLYIDDEPNNLVSFRATFRRIFTVEVANSAAEASELLKEKNFHIVISDQRMPKKNGTDFFAEIKDKYPEQTRILLTGFADLDAVIAAINDGNVYRYVTKPWNADELKIAILNGYERYDAQRRLSLKNEELKTAYAELEKFVYSASHDLRAPLASIMGLVKLAKKEENPQEFLGMIEDSTKQLDAFVQNIINFYQNRKQALVLESIELKSLLEEILRTHQHMDGMSKMHTELSISESLVLNSDRLRLKVIFNNLVSNAIKYRDTTKPEMRLAISAQEFEGKVEITINDNGIGIGPSGVEKIFDMFYRDNSVGSGSGIGLFLVKESVERLGGEIAVRSELGKVTTFQVILPIQPPHE